MITIGLPFYNDEKFLELAIQSVLKQTYTDFHLILMDDGSSDSSLEIAKKFENLDDRIKVYSDGLNKKLATRLNEIANLSQTKYLARMDADDIMHPERIEKQLKILEKNPNIDVLGTNAYSIDEQNNVQGIRMLYEFKEAKLIDVKGFIHPTIMAKTAWFSANPYDTKMVKAQDYELWQRTYDSSEFRVYTEPLLFYREFGKDFYKKYYKGRRSMFYVARKLNHPNNYFIAIRYFVKGIIFLVFNILGIEGLLIKKRNLAINELVKSSAEEILNQTIK